jgi:hypothetical protein
MSGRISSFPAPAQRHDNALVIVVLNQYVAAVYRCHNPGWVERQPSSCSGMAAFRNSLFIEEHEQAVAAGTKVFPRRSFQVYDAGQADAFGPTVSMPYQFRGHKGNLTSGGDLNVGKMERHWLLG